MLRNVALSEDDGDPWERETEHGEVRSIHVSANGIISFLSMNNTPLYIPSTFFKSIHLLVNI